MGANGLSTVELQLHFSLLPPCPALNLNERRSSSPAFHNNFPSPPSPSGILLVFAETCFAFRPFRSLYSTRRLRISPDTRFLRLLYPYTKLSLQVSPKVAFKSQALSSGNQADPLLVLQWDNSSKQLHPLLLHLYSCRPLSHPFRKSS